MIRIFAFILLVANISFAEESTIWSFVGRDGPNKWDSLDKRFQNCEGNKKATTVITNKDLAVNGAPLIFDYKDYAYPPISIEESKHINIGEKLYKLVEFHIHLPSEHSINDNISKAVVHFVHQDSNSNIVVVAVMIKEGESNPIIKNLIATVNDKPKIIFAVEDGDLTALLPTNKQYYYDQATITTCPCTGKVSWYIMKDPIEASAEEITGLKKTMPTK
jgi:carbonic anhydrase